MASEEPTHPGAGPVAWLIAPAAFGVVVILTARSPS
jgi:hypothetical protein